MATTDARPGFRLPWSADRVDTGEGADVPTQDAPSPESDGDQESETPAMIDAAPASSDPVAAVDPAVADATTAEAAVEPSHAPEPRAEAEDAAVGTAGAGKKPSKFLADLTKAMQAAAESARAETLARFTAEAKQHIETIHTDSANEATELRKRADDDVASIREWSKAEIARIRDETDQKINGRKADLEEEVEEHAAAIERRIERVQARVAAFEAEMDAFFERLLGEEDPTRFAAMAESLPEPPPFDGEDPVAPIAEAKGPEASAAATYAETQEADAEPAEATAETVADTTELIGDTAEAPTEEAPVEATAESAPETGGDLFSPAADAPAEGDADPRLAALGIGPDFAAAEAEAAAFTPEEAGQAEEIPTIGDDALAARLAHLVPDNDAPPTDVATTRVVVVGLVSVASIAGFKRHLSRVAGVQSVGVSSGPDGEFVFAVAHGPDVALRDAIALLPGFGARVTGEGDGGLTVTAHDPETEG
ncbi:MAG TPA: hypothetical protein VIH00_07185 [Candidatus Limnocylindrales bacterium]